jgi:hypothetical protein
VSEDKVEYETREERLVSDPRNFINTFHDSEEVALLKEILATQKNILEVLQIHTNVLKQAARWITVTAAMEE